MTNLVIFRGRLGALLSVFIIIFFRIELRCEWVNTKNVEFFMECCYLSVLLWNVFWSGGVIS